MIRLHDSIPLIVINEGRDKQRAAERSTEQIAHFLKTESLFCRGRRMRRLGFRRGNNSEQVKISAISSRLYYIIDGIRKVFECSFPRECWYTAS